MSLFRAQIDVFLVADHQPAAIARGNAVQALVRTLGYEPGGVRATLVEDRDLAHVPKPALKMLERETKARYGDAASVHDLTELREALLAAYGGQIAIFDDELLAMRRRFGYPPKDLVLERTRVVLERVTAPARGAA